MIDAPTEQKEIDLLTVTSLGLHERDADKDAFSAIYVERIGDEYYLSFWALPLPVCCKDTLSLLDWMVWCAMREWHVCRGYVKNVDLGPYRGKGR